MSVAQLFRDPPWHLKGPIDIVAELRKITANKLKMSNGLCIDQVKLTKGSVTGFKNFFIKQSNSEKIPWVYGPLSAMPVIGNAITAVTSTIDGLQRITAGPINSDQLAILMADGGSFVRWIKMSAVDRLDDNVNYYVNVGSEFRIYGICSATLPFRVV